MSKGQKNKLVPALRFPGFNGEWEEKLLGDILSSENSVLALNKLEFKEKGYPVYGADGLVGYIKFYVQPEDYIAILKDGSGVGKLFMYRGESSILGTLAYLKSNNSEDYNLNWAFYLLHTLDLLQHVKGSGIPHIYYTDYSKDYVAVPTPTEQQKIANCLWSLDELIDAESQKLDALKDHKKGLMQQLFPAEGKTVPELRFPGFSGEWEEKTLGEVARVTTGNKDTQNKVDDGIYPFFVRSQTIERINTYSYDGEAILTSGDGVGVGKNYHYINGRFDFHQRVYCIFDFDKNISGKFVYLYFSEHFYDRVMKLSAKNSVDSVRMAMITEMPVCLPNLKEQQKIADCLTAADKLITEQVERIEQLKEHKKGLMQQLFPSPNDEQ